eukprot:699164-Amphidinium_carterae.2
MSSGKESIARILKGSFVADRQFDLVSWCTWIPWSSNPADGFSRGDFSGLLQSQECHLNTEMVRHIMKLA